MSKRFKLIIEYDGTHYHGWQAQREGLKTVQGVIEDAIFKVTGEERRITAAGRTDTGVHAFGQVAHVDLDYNIGEEKLPLALNAHLRGEAVAILSAEIVDEEFSARFDAKQRHYVYKIKNRRSKLALDRNRSWLVVKPLDANAMQDAASVLLGKHDFTTFRHIACQAKSPIRTLDRLDVERHGENIYIYVSALSFLHHQVRSMVGCLKMVGEGQWTKQDLQNALEAKDRNRLGLNAPAHGLYFSHVDYD